MLEKKARISVTILEHMQKLNHLSLLSFLSIHNHLKSLKIIQTQLKNEA